MANLLKNLRNAVLDIPRRGRHNVEKILCLGAGLAMGSVIIAEVYFEQTYDTWFPNHERTYLVNEAIVRDGEFKEFPQTSGAIAKGLKDNCPQIEAATKITDIAWDLNLTVDGEKWLKADKVPIADSCFFDVFGNRVVEGDLKEPLSKPGFGVISRSLAEKIGDGSVIGRKLKDKHIDGIAMTIGGVYEDFPYGSSFHGVDVILASSTFGWFENIWVGTDRFSSYIRLRPGATLDDLKPGVKAMMEAHEEFKQASNAGVDFDFTFTNVPEAYSQSPTVKRMCWILLLLAGVLLFSTVMNYLLIVVGNMAGRFREMAVRKCYGARPADIHGIILTECIVHVFVGIGLAALVLWLCKGTVEQLISAPLEVLLFNRGAWLLGLVVVLIVLIGGVLPGSLFARIPVTAAFRGIHDARRRWKLALLGFEFVAVGLLLSLLMVVHRQYTMMVNDNPGYDYENVAVVTVNGLDNQGNRRAEEELGRMSEVAMVTSCSQLPLYRHSGNNVYVPEIPGKELFNIADQYFVTANYLELLNIPIVEGRGFTTDSDSLLNEVMVDERFVEKIKAVTGWKGSVVGKRVGITEHSQYDDPNSLFTIVGVYKNHRLGTMTTPEARPSVLFYAKAGPSRHLAKLHNLTPETMESLRVQMRRLFPGQEVDVTDFKFYMWNAYKPQASFRRAVTICSVIILLIALMGLVGYTVDEVTRRRKEIAIRKVNGATLGDVLRLFVKGIAVIAIPSLALGAAFAYFIAKEWLTMFAERVSLNPAYFVASVAALLSVIAGVVVANCYKVANANPVDYLKSE